MILTEKLRETPLGGCRKGGIVLELKGTWGAYHPDLTLWGQHPCMNSSLQHVLNMWISAFVCVCIVVLHYRLQSCVVWHILSLQHVTLLPHSMCLCTWKLMRKLYVLRWCICCVCLGGKQSASDPAVGGWPAAASAPPTLRAANQGNDLNGASLSFHLHFFQLRPFFLSFLLKNHFLQLSRRPRQLGSTWTPWTSVL